MTAGSRWYRQPFVWLLVAVPASAVLMGAVTVWLAVRSDDGLVVDDYYKRGMQINRVLRRDRAAAEAGLYGILDLAGGRVTLRLKAERPLSLPGRLELGLYHATRSGLDRTVRLDAVGQGAYAGAAPPLVPGAWNIQVGTDAWRLTGRLGVGDVRAGRTRLTPDGG